MRRARGFIFAGLAVALVLAGASAWLASGEPDGLERVAADHEFIDTARDPGYEILPGYTVPGIQDERVSTALAGVAGVLLVAGLAAGAGRLLRRRGHPHG